MNPVLKAGQFRARFAATRVLSELSFSVNKGESLAIIGPNGAGKTLLLRAPTGSISFSGTVQQAGGTQIGYVPQKLYRDRDIAIAGCDFLQARVAAAATTNQCAAQ
jgi:ABC-type Mn2+/Zn2+ transport system ATPase subunit